MTMQSSPNLLRQIQRLEEIIPKLKELAEGQGSELDVSRAIGLIRARTSDIEEALFAINTVRW